MEVYFKPFQTAVKNIIFLNSPSHEQKGGIFCMLSDQLDGRCFLGSLPEFFGRCLGFGSFNFRIRFHF